MLTYGHAITASTRISHPCQCVSMCLSLQGWHGAVHEGLRGSKTLHPKPLMLFVQACKTWLQHFADRLRHSCPGRPLQVLQKVPPFRDVVMLVQHEYSSTTNSGLVYVQNAKPDGPAVFVLSEVANRAYRWADDDWHTASSLHLRHLCLYQDQDAYGDILPDMASGYMLFPRSFVCTDKVSELCATADRTVWHTLPPHCNSTCCTDKLFIQGVC